MVQILTFAFIVSTVSVMSRNRGRPRIISQDMEDCFAQFLQSHSIDTNALSMTQFKAIANYFFKKEYGVGLLCTDDIVLQSLPTRRSARLANR